MRDGWCGMTHDVVMVGRACKSSENFHWIFLGWRFGLGELDHSFKVSVIVLGVPA